MPTFTGTTEKTVVPIKNKRYQIPEYPFDGPMPADAEPVRGNGMLKPWTRVSTLLDTHEDKEGLIHWNARLVAKGIGDRPDLYALAASTRLEDKQALRQLCSQAFDHARGQASANLGTALHNFLERTLEGEKNLHIPDPWRADVAAVLAKFQEHGITVAGGHQELVIVRPDLRDGDSSGLAGRTDIFVEMPNEITGERELVPADYKTGSDPLAYGSWKIEQQIGIYGSAWATWDGEFWRPMPANLRRDKVLMIHILPGTGQVEIYVNYLDTERLEADLRAAYRTRARRKQAKKAWSVLGSDPEVAKSLADVEIAQRAQAAEREPEYVGPVQTEDQMAELREAMHRKIGGPSFGGTGKPLAELAGDGERGCSVCRRKGHRKGSPVCLGENDPAITPDPMTPAEEEFSDQQAPIEHCPGHGAGWTNDGTGKWVCAECGLPSKAVATKVFPGQPEESYQDCCGTAEGWPHRGECPQRQEDEGAPEHVADTTAVGGVTENSTAPASSDDDDLFDDEAPADADRELFLSRIAEAKDKATMRAIRDEARELGIWEGEVETAARAKVRTL